MEFPVVMCSKTTKDRSTTEVILIVYAGSEYMITAEKGTGWSTVTLFRNDELISSGERPATTLLEQFRDMLRTLHNKNISVAEKTVDAWIAAHLIK